jgi:hypothetical protein
VLVLPWLDLFGGLSDLTRAERTEENQYGY